MGDGVEATTPLGYAQANQESCLQITETFSNSQPTPELKAQISLPTGDSKQIEVFEVEEACRESQAGQVDKGVQGEACTSRQVGQTEEIGLGREG
jgi:hypothetical protein